MERLTGVRERLRNVGNEWIVSIDNEEHTNPQVASVIVRDDEAVS